jgi:hypothetical protein
VINVVLCGYCGKQLTDEPGAFAAHDSACEHNPLTKRVAELEGSIRGLLACQDSLLSQLAWTPVVQGLPTEPGVYEFVKWSNECLHSCDLLEFCPDRENEGEEWGDMLTCEHFCTDELQELEHTHFRRITLPEAT